MTSTVRSALALIGVIAACGCIALAAIGPAASTTHRPSPTSAVKTATPTATPGAPLLRR